MTALLIALLTLTGLGTAVAKGLPQSVGMIELCAGQVTLLVAVDADGEPTAPHYRCPDCTLLALDMFASEADLTVVRKEAFVAPKPAVITVVAVQRILSLKARAPPVSV